MVGFGDQKDLDRQARWVRKNSLKFNKGKYRVLLLGKNNPRHQHRLGVTCWEAPWWRRSCPPVLVDNRLAMSQQ